MNIIEAIAKDRIVSEIGFRILSPDKYFLTYIT